MSPARCGCWRTWRWPSTLIVLDHRGGWLSQLRAAGAALLMQPLWWLAGLPGRAGRDASATTPARRSQLTAENRRLRNELLVTQRAHGAAAGGRRPRTRACAACSARPSAAASTCSWRRSSTSTSIPPASAWCSTPAAATACASARRDRRRRRGRPDHRGRRRCTSTVLLLTDPDHAMPVAVARTGVRLVAYGTGRSDQLALCQHAAVERRQGRRRAGDLGPRRAFPAGFPVGTIAALQSGRQPRRSWSAT